MRIRAAASLAARGAAQVGETVGSVVSRRGTWVSGSANALPLTQERVTR